MTRKVVPIACLAVFAAVSTSPAADSGAARRLPHAGPAISSTAGQVLIQFSLYRVHGDIGGEPTTSGLRGFSLTDNIREGIEGGKLEAVQDPFVFFVLSNVRVAGVLLRANENGWTWDGQDRPPSNGRVETLAAPKVMVLPPNSFVIEISPNEPVQYFEKRPDGTFELKSLQEKTGLSLSGTVEKGATGRIVLRNLTLRFRSIGKRKPIEGVGLDVGEPIFEQREFKTTIAVKSGREYGMLIAGGGYGSLILRLKADLNP
jgi:hypothetical protein